MRYFLGIDVGTTKTHALIADETGVCLCFGESTGGNHQVVGYAGLQHALKDSFHHARTASGLKKNQITGAGFGIAGYDFPSDREFHLKAVSRLGLSCPVGIINDGKAGLISGTSRGVGVNVTAGSSINCRGKNASGKEGRILGNGAMFGEYGGGVEIAAKALQMINYAWIKRIPPTSLTQIVLDATGAKSELDLMRGFSCNDFRLLPDMAREIIRAAHAGDAAARDIIHWAGEEIGWLAVAVTRQIEMEDDSVEIVQSGSIFDAGEIITNPMRDIILEHCPGAKIARLDGPPVVGPLMLGMQLTGIDPYPLRTKLISTAKNIVNLAAIARQDRFINNIEPELPTFKKSKPYFSFLR
jgi:N-acetylglucosamine kinase-like BadF-type ATPase